MHLLDLFRRPAGYRIPSDVRARYRTLYDELVRPTPDGGATFHPGRLWQREGIHVLHVCGDRFEMAFQHGRLLREPIAHGSLAQASRLAANGVRSSLGDGALAHLVSWYSRAAIAEPILRHGLARARAAGADPLLEAYGLSEGAGVPVGTVIHAALGPETAQTLLGQTARIGTGAHPSQCTSFAAWGSKTRGGSLVIGRNTDYPLTGFFDAHPTVIYFEPTDGAQRYMCVTSAGFHNAGVCGMNDAGLYLAVHTVPAAHVSEHGLPVFLVAQHVLRESRTLAQAEAAFLDFRPAAGWNYHVVSVGERRAATFELACDRVAVRPSSGDWHITTNHWTQPEMDSRHLFVNSTVETDTRMRMARVAELIENASGELDAAGAAAILADRHDGATGRTRIMPNVIAAPTTVSSSVWLPEQGLVLVANGTAPVPCSSYVELPTLGAFDPATLADRPCRAIRNDRFRFEHPQLAAAEQLFIRAHDAFEYRGDVQEATGLLELAVAGGGGDPALLVTLGILAVRAERLDVARRALDACVEGFDDARRRLARYVRGRVLAHQGDVPGALADLRAVDADEACDAKLAAAARRARERLQHTRRLPLGRTDIAPMMFLPDAFRYEGLSPWR